MGGHYHQHCHQQTLSLIPVTQWTALLSLIIKSVPLNIHEIFLQNLNFCGGKCRCIISKILQSIIQIFFVDEGQSKIKYTYCCWKDPFFVNFSGLWNKRFCPSVFRDPRPATRDPSTSCSWQYRGSDKLLWAYHWRRLNDQTWSSIGRD